MEEERRHLKFVFRLPSKDKKTSAEIKVQEKIQSFGSSSPCPSFGAENMEKLQNGSKDCDTQSRSSRFCIKIQPKVKKVSHETKDDQEEQKIIDNTGIPEEGKKMGALHDEGPKNFRLDEAEAKKRKRGFTLALSREQIEEDILELLGSKPPSSSRRPKKRSRASQQRLKNLFPGAWLESLID